MDTLVSFYSTEIKSLFAVLFTPLCCRCLSDFQYLLSCFQSQLLLSLWAVP